MVYIQRVKNFYKALLSVLWFCLHYLKVLFPAAAMLLIVGLNETADSADLVDLVELDSVSSVDPLLLSLELLFSEVAYSFAAASWAFSRRVRGSSKIEMTAGVSFWLFDPSLNDNARVFILKSPVGTLTSELAFTSWLFFFLGAFDLGVMPKRNSGSDWVSGTSSVI